ncbi:MAG: hypothetical protein JWO06_1876 [Bacteroidota bacterium]|nr:hypothetical protein [Bacteroidota bacterium]
MPNFTHNFCDPLKPDVIELGPIAPDKIVGLFNSFPFDEHLKKMNAAKKEEICYSPSLAFENVQTKSGICISVLGETAVTEYMIFYKRPRNKKSFFGLVEKLVPDYCTDITVEEKEKAVAALEALIKGDTDYLENAIK